MNNLISNKDPNYILLKELLKSGKEGIVATDDISVLRLIKKYPIKLISLFYSTEIEYHKDTLEDIKYLSNKAKNTYIISKKNIEALKRKENSACVFGIIDISLKTLDDLKDLDFLVVCDSLEIPGNLGTIYRTCDSAKVGGVILVNTITKPNNPSLVSSSRGCNLLIPTVSTTYEDAQKWLLDNNYDIYLGEPNLGLDYQKYDYKSKIAIVVGNERFGINPKWYDNLHKKVFIPMFG